MGQFLWDHILLVVLMLTSGGVLVWPAISGLLSGARAIGTLEATRLMNQGNTLVMDVRDPAEFAAGRIPKSKNVPLPELEKRMGEVNRFKEKPVIVTAGPGNRESRAMRALKAAGFSQIYSLKGGVNAWREAGLPVEK